MTSNAQWLKSSYSQNSGGNCLECRHDSHHIDLRDTQHRHLGHLTVPCSEWAAFLHALRTHEL
ncbi:DUF397 domain-containing protein [Lipingzhangella sp. LS1_29]|uniref:DUF397 domain-containing protein n=1 Tax=Lipingzhangella rawalii TaxID=2055835 RepID=A0ABU2HAU2_9ACTN|nr:DUF397 domain-containing protein [Lipingzhangella rawalii]MDS1272441.1 DUF397 domain-containing protein [Lipingzhangella rawalii]